MHHVLQCLRDALQPVDALVEIRQLAARHFPDPRAVPGAVGAQHLGDLLEREAGRLGAADEAQAAQQFVVVFAVSASACCGHREQAPALLVTDGLRPDACLSGESPMVIRGMALPPFDSVP